MQEVRKQKRVLSRFQVDIKYLTDIPEYEIRKMGTPSSGISYHRQRL